MSEVLVYAETGGGSIHPVSYELLGKGAELADKLGVKLSAFALSVSDLDWNELIYRGADRVYVSVSPEFSIPDERIFQAASVELLSDIEPDVVLFGATNFGRSLAPRIAMSLDTGLTADCTGLDIDEDGNLVQIRPAFSGNILAHINTKTRPQMATVRYKEMSEPARDSNRTGEIVEYDVSLDGQGSGLELLNTVEKSGVNLAEAEVVVSGGRGLKDASDFQLLEQLAELLNGHVGASRPVVDDGWISRDHQVGYSGNRVQPRVYFACGISGQSQHLAGMKESDVIIAINKDPSAPIFEVADYGIVGDLYEVVPELIDQIKEATQSGSKDS